MGQRLGANFNIVRRSALQGNPASICSVGRDSRTAILGPRAEARARMLLLIQGPQSVLDW